MIMVMMMMMMMMVMIMITMMMKITRMKKICDVINKSRIKVKVMIMKIELGLHKVKDIAV